jgi:hypothetical protein
VLLGDGIRPVRIGRRFIDFFNVKRTAGTVNPIKPLKNEYALFRFPAGFWPRIPPKYWTADKYIPRARETAISRSAAADRRATTIATSVSIAASFVLGGGSLALDTAKMSLYGLRLTFSVVLFLAVILFTLSAVYALRSLVIFRKAAAIDPRKMLYQRDLDLASELQKRAAGLMHDFSYNWEVSEVKNYNVDLAVRCLVAALMCIGVLAGLFVVGVIGEGI